MARLFRNCLTLVLLFGMTGCAMFQSTAPTTCPPSMESVTRTARSQIDVPYRTGGNSPNTGFDCSGLVQWCYGVHGYTLPRRTEDLLHIGVPVAKEDLMPGDLVFFNVTRKRWGLHVGLYSGHGMFIHSPTPGAKVREENLFERYWVRTYIGARRVLHPD